MSGVSGFMMADDEYIGFIGDGTLCPDGRSCIMVWSVNSSTYRTPLLNVSNKWNIPSYYSIKELGIDPKSVERKKTLSNILLCCDDPIYEKVLRADDQINKYWESAVIRLLTWKRRLAAVQVWELANA